MQIVKGGGKRVRRISNENVRESAIAGSGGVSPWELGKVYDVMEEDMSRSSMSFCVACPSTPVGLWDYDSNWELI